MTRTRLLLAVVIITAITSSSYMAAAWWIAAFSSDWSVTLRFGWERWVEGILFHALAVVSLFSIWYFRPGGKYAGTRRSNATRRMAMSKERPLGNRSAEGNVYHYLD